MFSLKVRYIIMRAKRHRRRGKQGCVLLRPLNSAFHRPILQLAQHLSRRDNAAVLD